MTDKEMTDRLLAIVKNLTGELSIVADEAGQAMSPENATKLNEYVNGVLARTNEQLAELLPSASEGLEP